jgi:orotate phosphoribosyltransferase
MVRRDELAAAINRVAHLTGDFVLRSGQTSTEYFDKFQFTSRVDLLDAVTDELAELVPRSVEVLAGLQLGGVPLAAALALKTRLPAVYVRLDRKSYGTRRIVEGLSIEGKRVAVVEDVVTTGGQIVASTGELRGEGAEVGDVLAVVERGPAARENLRQQGLDLHALFTAGDLERSSA